MKLALITFSCALVAVAAGYQYLPPVLKGFIYGTRPGNQGYPHNNLYNAHVAGNETKCEKCGPQPPDCNQSPNEYNSSYVHGHEYCSCNGANFPRGCTLKPCDGSSTSICFCSNGDPMGSDQCFKYRCTGEDEECETCIEDSFPPDCTEESTPPINNGTDCSCSQAASPSGCTLRPCRNAAEETCICEPGVYSKFCLSAKCPGSMQVSRRPPKSHKYYSHLQSTSNSIYSPSYVGLNPDKYNKQKRSTKKRLAGSKYKS